MIATANSKPIKSNIIKIQGKSTTGNIKIKYVTLLEDITK
jgi:hypothetical protein